jgi:hypothetical protein
MIIIWGQRNYGKVDKVGDFCYVATQFGHLWFIPLIPIQTYIVIAGSETDDGFKGVPIGFSAKSILIAWLRAALIIATPILFFLALVSTVEALKGSAAGLVGAAFQWLMFSGAAAGIWLTYLVTRAGLNRAMQLADQLGVSRLAVAKVVHPDRTDEELLTQIGEDETQPGYKHYP